MPEFAINVADDFSEPVPSWIILNLPILNFFAYLTYYHALIKGYCNSANRKLHTVARFDCFGHWKRRVGQ